MARPMVFPTMAAAIGPRAMPTSFTKGAPRARALENLIFKGESAADRQRRDIFFLSSGSRCILIEKRMQFHRGDSPFVHHAPRAHPGAAAGPVDGEQVQLVLGGEGERPARSAGR